MSALDIFTYSGQQVRTVVIDGEPWFVAVDVATILDAQAASGITRMIDDEDRGFHKVETPGGSQSLVIVNESGLWTALLRSNNPKAKPLRKWITAEVLPTIRKTGTYSLAPIETPEQLLARALTVANGVLEQKNATIAVLEPKAEAYDRVIATGDAQKIEYAARKANVGRTTAFQLLRAAGVLQKFNRSPKQQYAHRFIEEPKPFTNAHTGLEEIGWVTKVRPEHLDWLVTKLIDLKSEGLPNV